ncbi:amino acid adenylation domain-containing protein [Lysobacter enzymogenes]|uniref:amino acid adenylation domain-containing protein n=1 Tax=Lysobacter enzymogenes TaxID=69 RepID=UPI003747FD4F
MLARDIYDEALAADILLYLKEGALAYKAARGIPDDLQRRIRENKQQILAYLHQVEARQARASSARRRPEALADRSRLPLSRAQRRVWFADKQSQDGGQFNIQGCFLFEGALDPQAFRQALRYLLDRHEVLRANFLEVDGELQQRICTDRETPLERIDLSEGGAGEEAARGIIEADLRRPFDLARGALLRVALLRLREDRHVAVFNMHHIVSDGWSVGILIEEFCRAYAACRNAESLDASPAALQYADLAAWQEARLRDGDLEADIAFCRSQLDGIPELHSLPTDKSRPAQQTFDGALCRSRVPQALAGRIEAFCLSRKLTLFMFLETAFGALLSLYGGERDVVIGTPVAGRDMAETESMVGLFVNTVVLRNAFDPESGFEQLLQANKARILAAFERQHVPLEELVARIGHPRSGSYSPLFQIWFVLQNNRKVDFALPDCRVSEYAAGAAPAAKFDLSLYAKPGDDGIELDWVFNPDLFDARTIQYVADEFVGLLTGILDRPDQPYTAHGAFAGRVPAREDFAAPALATTAQGDDGLLAAVRRNMAEAGDAVALVSEGEAWTYRDLAQLERRYRAILQRSGESGRIGLLFAKGPQIVAAMLAALALRRIYVNLDPNYPQARLAYMLDHSGCGLILADAAHAPLAQSIAGSRRVVCEIADDAGADDACVADADNDIAYLLYTSGSTGRPKGVAQSRLNLGYQAESYARALALSAQDRILQLASYSFDASVLDTYGGLFAGAAVHLADVGAVAAADLLASIRAQGITVYHSTPTVFNYLFAAATPDDTAGIRAVVLGGEAVGEHTLQIFRRAFAAKTRLFGLYGASEASLVALAEIGADAVDAGLRGDLGQCIAGTGMSVVRDDGSPCRTFETGQIVVRSRYVAKGYWDAPELTAERFRACPDGTVEFHTGDIGYMTPQGRVRFAGRRDAQVKLNGIRVELGEVEAALRGLEEVSRAAAVVRDAGTGGELVAYVVSPSLHGAADRQAQESRLARQYRAGLRQWLPDYMIPAVFVFIEQMPATPSGKTDYRALPAVGESVRRDRFVAARDPFERRLCAIWESVLGRERIGVDDNFFSLGGDSLHGLRMLSLVREAFGVELSVREFFAQATVAEMAALLRPSLREPHAGDDAARAAPPPQSADEVAALVASLAERGVRIYVEGGSLKTSGAANAITAELGAEIRRLKPELLRRLAPPAAAPGERAVHADEGRALSFAQQRLWFLDHFGGGSVSYNMPIALRLDGELDAAALRRALERIVERHAVLRTVYRKSQGAGVQVALASATVPMQVVDLSASAEARQAEELRRMAQAQRTLAFDLQRDPMLRVVLVRLGEARHVLYLTLHHIAADGWSLGVLVREFAALYQACREGRDDPLPPLGMQYADFADWQRQPAQLDRAAKELPFWRDALVGIPQLHGLPLDKPRPPHQGAGGRVVRHRLGAARLAELKRFAGARHATLYMVLQSAFALLLARWSGERDIVVGTPTAGRTLPATEAMIGCFVNTLALRTRLDETMGYEELLARTRGYLLEAYDRQHLPFETLVESLNPPRSLSHGPLFQVMFALQNYQMDPLHLPGLSIEEIANDAPNAKFDLGVIVHEDEHGLMFNWVFAEALFDASSIARMAAGLDALLQAIVDAPLSDVFDLPIQAAADAAAMWSRAQAAGQCVLDRRGRIQPVGAIGEIHRPGPPGADGAMSWRATGCIGRCAASGETVALGWAGGDTHVNGLRVPTATIESALLELDAVAAACVALRRPAAGGDGAAAAIVAYVVPASGAARETLAAACSGHLLDRLPDYLVPAGVVVVDALPADADGRVEVGLLPLPVPAAEAGHVAPADELERQLCGIWAGVLMLDRVGVRDNFFSVGGTSLHCILVQQEILRATGYEIAVTDIFNCPTVAALAGLLRAGARDRNAAAAVPPNAIALDSTAIAPDMLPLIDLSQAEIDRIVAQVDGGAGNVQDMYALTPLQDGIMFHYRLAQEGDPYLLGSEISFRDRARLDAFLAAVQQVVDRHDVLRTAFFWEGLSRPVQVVLRKAALAVTEVELDPLDGPVAEQLRERFDVRRTRVDLARPPLLSYVIAYDAQHDRWLVLQRFQHLAGDHVTLEQLRSEVLAIVEGRADELPPPVPYRVMVAQAQAGDSQDGHEEFFGRMLGDIVEPSLPFGLVDVHRHGGDVLEARSLVTPALDERLRAQARRLGVSVASLCHLAWGMVLARAAGSERVVFGTVLLGRMQTGELAGRVVGLTINTLPVRIDLDGIGVEAAVGEVHARLTGLLQHEQASLALAQRCSGVEARAPLFNAILNYRHSSPETVRIWPQDHPFNGAEFRTVEERTNYPIALSVDDYGQGLGLTAQVAAPLSPQRVCGYVERALESLAEALETAPHAPTAQLEVLPANERALLVDGWNDTRADYPRDRCVHRSFEIQARRTPDAVAVAHGGSALRYRDLDAQANRLAQHLVALGVRPDGRVALCVERGPAMVVGLLAILKAGGAYVPLDPRYPSERLARVVEDACPTLVLADAAGRAALGTAALAQRRVVDLDPLAAGAESDTAWASQPADPPQVAGLTSAHLAYVIYTSGSTGAPKGVEIEHRQLGNFLAAMASLLRLEASDAWLAVTSISFDIAALELYLPLICGARTVVADHDDAMDPARLSALLADHSIGFMQATPATWSALLAAQWPGSPTLAALCGGEPMPPSFRTGLRGRCGSLWNLYGPTETTVWSSCFRVEADGAETLAASVPIGRPIANTRMYVLDPQGRPMPLGAVGELHIGGDGVARGYLNRAETTAERFLPDPFAADPAARMYRTGDLARQSPDGDLVYVGRNDQQVKIRGFRIELGEIEACLTAHADVREAVVAARGEGAEKRLIAYVLPTEGDAGGADMALGLRAHLQARLPDYMVPAAFLRVAAWPLTPNGKLDRKALPSADGDVHAARVYEAPHEGVEAVLAALWCDVLRVERVGRHDDFFELGGHSLLAVSLLARIRQTLGVELSVATLFAKYTLAALAQAVADAGGRGPSAAAAAIVAVPRDRPLPLSFAQQRLWFLAQWPGVSAKYHIPLALRIRGELDRAALRRSLDALFARHEALRSVFDAVEGQPRLRLLAADTAFALTEHDLDASSPTPAELSRAEAQAPFDLAQGPLIRGRLLTSAADEHLLLLTQHHIVSDGWSIGVLSSELGALYRAFRQGLDDPLPPLPMQYPDYAAWQGDWLSGERLQRQVGYWREALAGAPALLELPTDRPRPERLDLSGAQVQIALDEDLTRELKRLGQRHGATLFMTLAAAWAAVLSRLSGQRDVVIGTPTANRALAETDGLIGFFVNTLALRVDLDGAPGVGELLSRVRSAALAAQDHQDLPFEQVVETVQPPRRLNHTPIFQVLFNWQNVKAELPDFAGLQVELAATAYEAVKCDLELSLAEVDGRIVGNLAYATALFDAATIERHVGYLVALLRGMAGAESEGRPVEDIEVISAAERTLLLDGWNSTTADFPQDRCIHQLFEEQARRTPDATAAICGERALSYRELNAHANALAHRLIALGVRPDDRVAICAERSLAMPLGLLAILKSGAAYVPLDPTYPAERLAQIVEDCDPQIVLCDAAGATALGRGADAQRTLIDIEPLRSPEAAPVRSSAAMEDPQVDGLTWRNLAYVIYTSGSTGRPKGAMNEHRALINRLTWMQDAYRLDGDDVVLQKTSFSFDVSVWEFFWPLLQGATLLVAPPEAHKDPVALAELIERGGVTTVHFVPSMLGAFLLTAQAERCTALRRIVCSGEALQPIHVLGCRQKLPGAGLHNLYGPTEAAIDVTAWTCPASFEGGPVPIGRPIANTRIYLLDPALRPVPLGAAGELYIGGVGVARGYLERPELSAERFLRDPFVDDATATMYRTGDLARYRRDGEIEYLGRCDFQVKIRGFRIELGEIETRLAEHALVREAVVLVREEGGEQRLVAYVLAADRSVDSGALAAALRSHLAAALPEYMLPAATVRMDEWPLTPNGKLDRKALPAPLGDAFVRREYEAPQGEIEQTIAAVWQELLQVDRVGRQDGFFELGGSSLLAVRVLSALNERLSVRVDLAALFKHPTFADFAKHVLMALIEQQFGVEAFENFIISEGV